MHVEPWVWAVTVGLTVAFLVVDIFYIGRSPHEPSTGESARHLAFFIGTAVLFGVGVSVISGARYGVEFFGGWLTEYSLSVDNLFVFLIIMTKLRVPRHLQQTALLIGIIVALLLRGVFIAAGAAAINAFSWVFYLFGAFLVYTAVRLAGGAEHNADEYTEGRVVRWIRRRVPSTTQYHDAHVVVRGRDGRRLVTPMMIVIIALGTTDLLFALDSILAIYGITREPYLVLTANVFALMGLRQLYFLIGGLLERLAYLSVGLSVLLGFIGVKLILTALHENTLPFINGGQPVTSAPEIPTWLSLLVIVAILVITVLASLVKSRRDARARARP